MPKTRFDLLSEAKLYELGCYLWSSEDRPRILRAEESILLIPGSRFDEIADGTILTDIMGGESVAGRNRIDDDTRGGYLAYGIRLSVAQFNNGVEKAREADKPVGISVPERPVREIQLSE